MLARHPRLRACGRLAACALRIRHKNLPGPSRSSSPRWANASVLWQYYRVDTTVSWLMPFLSDDLPAGTCLWHAGGIPKNRNRLCCHLLRTRRSGTHIRGRALLTLQHVFCSPFQKQHPWAAAPEATSEKLVSTYRSRQRWLWAYPGGYGTFPARTNMPVYLSKYHADVQAKYLLPQHVEGSGCCAASLISGDRKSCKHCAWNAVGISKFSSNLLSQNRKPHGWHNASPQLSTMLDTAHTAGQNFQEGAHVGWAWPGPALKFEPCVL